MEVKILAKNRVLITHKGQTVRIEIVDGSPEIMDQWRIYYPPNATIHTTSQKVVGYRKVILKMADKDRRNI